MNENKTLLVIGDTPLKQSDKVISGEYVIFFDELFYKISNYDAIEPFFMSIVSSSDHWLFIASTGGLSTGRVSAEQALFPYYTVDKITENSENTGNEAILLVTRSQRTSLWEPFSERYRGNYCIKRNIYKNISSTTIIFEEINLDLGITYRYSWRTSDKFGFIKTTSIINFGSSTCQVNFVDGIQNILPTNVGESAQLTLSSLLDAYKRSELNQETGLAIFALNSNMTDLAEPSESLLATTVAQLGIQDANYLLSSTQLDHFRQGNDVVTETEVRGMRGAYFVHAKIELAQGSECKWYLLADVSQDSTSIIEKIEQLQSDKTALIQDLDRDIANNKMKLWEIIASADGLQLSNDKLATGHHFANVMFNVMRGGIFRDQYWVRRDDFIEFVSIHCQSILSRYSDFFTKLPDEISASELKSRGNVIEAPDLIRLSHSYLPLSFSRRHGDPSRPWNRFTIKLKNPDGSLRLDYEGNWRDIFQNWEALAYSFPEFVESMICTLLNATTVDGYNPYRITYQGIDWELPEPGSPWANIGYWSDHQIIYLLKLMEISSRVHPGELQTYLDRPMFSYAHIPYQIKPYQEILKDPFNTIIFDWDLEKEIEARLHEYGTDGKLVLTHNGGVLQVSLTEKLLTLLLAKLVNFVPEGGIWMNTQRPEWNDANNALVGKGLSVVMLGYLRRYVAFCRELFNRNTLRAVSISIEVHQFYSQVSKILNYFQPTLQESLNDRQRRTIMDALGEAGSDYRGSFYQDGLSGEHSNLTISDLIEFLELVQQYIEHSLRANKRSDNLFHTYNILHLDRELAHISHLYEMLEGQVSILSSGLLSGDESLVLLQSLKRSALFQADQHSYILYPDRDVPGFLEKNCLTEKQVNDVVLFTKLLEADNKTLISKDNNGLYHFNGHFHNVRDVSNVLDVLRQDPKYATLVEAESKKITTLFEEIFHHDEFTGRAGTFFAYEGLGSIYWHMVSKLLLAVQEATFCFNDESVSKGLIDSYADIRVGLGFNKTPEAFGAFPTDPYSHTPKGQGAKQPGMTGSVKEEILTRLGELGLRLQNGQLRFDMLLHDPKELLDSPSLFSWIDVSGQTRSFELPPRSLAYTFCQTPIILQAMSYDGIEVYYSDGSVLTTAGQFLDKINSQHIFMRDGFIEHLRICFNSREER